jgi:L-Ala-D/L-Glu epimerase
LTFRMTVERRDWRRREPFVISRERITVNRNLLVTLEDESGFRGRGEGCPVAYRGETAEGLVRQIETVRPQIEEGLDRLDLLELLPPGAARAAVDAALWDIEARKTRVSAFRQAGLARPQPVICAFTIGMRSIAAYREAAELRANYPLLKVKVGLGDPIEAVAAVRAGAPTAALIVDPNQAWSLDALKSYAPRLADLGVGLLEQPIRVGEEAGLDGYRCPTPLCADELINDVGDLDKAQGRFGVVNIKLDKSGGLTQGLRLADAASNAGFRLMVGCLGGSSLAMAPAMVLAGRCDFVDLDGALHQAEDFEPGLNYRSGWVDPPDPGLWGGADSGDCDV